MDDFYWVVDFFIVFDLSRVGGFTTHGAHHLCTYRIALYKARKGGLQVDAVTVCRRPAAPVVRVLTLSPCVALLPWAIFGLDGSADLGYIALFSFPVALIVA